MAVDFIPLAIVALLTLGGLGTLALIAIVAIIKRRPGIAAAALFGGLLLIGLLIPATLGISYVRMQSPGPFEVAGPIQVFGHPLNSQMDVRWNGLILGALIVGGAIVALIGALARRPANSHEQRSSKRGGLWWPALVLLPLILFFFFGTVRVHTSRRHAMEEADRSVRRAMEVAMEAATREQQRAARQAEAIGEKIARHIEQADIHELMDQFDEPRIVLPSPLPVPLPATVAWIGRIYLPEPILARQPTSRTTAVAAAEASAPQGSESDAQVVAEAAEPAESVAAEIADHEVDKDVGSAPEAEPADEDEPKSDADAHASTTQPTEPVVEAAELSTPIGAAAAATPVAETARPDWVKFPPKRVGQVQREVTVTDEWSTEAECERERDVALLLKTYEHIQGLVGTPYHHQPLQFKKQFNFPDGWAQASDYRLRQLDSAGITLHFVRTEIAREEYLETVDRSVGPMKKLHTLIEFTPAVDKQLVQFWDTFRRRERFAAVGVGTGGIVGLLGFVYGLLKVDTWTKGYYTKRLLLGVPAALAGLAGLLAWLA